MDNLYNDEKECNSISQILKLQAKVIPKKKLLDKDMFDMSGLKKSNKTKKSKKSKKKY
tara:strand:+ start:3687 stop:3860 length:174 start_codon:yes stop_codon:yes gene_type:complete